ncbi:MAG: thioredoxin domain-containing protein [Oscillochloris sp.]|nr:thioredoxin domain-containing protein [Oscillochloris sp.]
MKHLPLLLLIATVGLISCGQAAEPVPTISALAARQTTVSIQQHPTMPPVPTVPTATPRPFPEVLAVTDDDPRALGSPTAPVTIYEFTDFECPFCVQFFKETRAQLIADYVDKGIVRLVARDFPLSDAHPSATLAATAAHCAAAQQQFWPMYEALFSTHGVEWGGVPKRDRQAIIDLASGIGMDITAFSACLDHPATTQAVAAEVHAAAEIGVNSTPNFMVNGQLIRGALPISSFRQLIAMLVQ